MSPSASTSLRDILSAEILPSIEKPSRYLGTEVNSSHKDLASVDVRIALCFPDLYDIGLGNLGLHILYAILNGLEGVWAERVYAPAKDMEAALRQRGLPIFALESKDPLSAFDGIGFTLQSELTFTNILNVIDMAGLPLRTVHRRPNDPLTFAGGPAVFNPEPLAPFMDFFVIGDGEDIVPEIAAIFRQYQDRDQRLLALSKVQGIYVPALCPVAWIDEQWIPQGPPVVKRTTKDLNGASFPVNYVVPFTEQVHDRISMEVLRGCTQGCRFCQAGMTTRPVRERSIDKIEDLMQRTLDATGYEEVSLVSLSTCDYSKVRQLVERTVARARDQHVSISLPSLRLDSFSVELADMVADTRRTGLTFAPEAASPRLRAVINKWIPDEDLLEMATEAYARGWDHVKLYFMIGLPTERDDDILAISDLCDRALREGKRHNRRASIHTGVSTFVPKPFTPFQWAEQISPAETDRRQKVLLDRFRHNKSIKFGRHNAFETFIEGLISRADRRAADLIEAAFRKGARFDAWTEHCDQAVWLEAISDTAYDTVFALRERRLDEALPWDHLDIHIPKKWFAEDWERATLLQHAPDCRHSKCHKCGVIDVQRPLCAAMLRNSIAGTKEEKTWERKPLAPYVEPQVVQRLRARIGRQGDMRFLSHLESMHAWLRALRRAQLPVGWSQGFHAHPRVNFSAAVPVGEESVADYMDLSMVRRVDPQAAFAALSAVLPPDLLLLEVVEVGLREPGVMALVRGFSYSIHPPQTEGLAEQVEALLARSTLEIIRQKEGSVKRVDLRPFIKSLELRDGALWLQAHCDGGRTAKPRDLVEFLGLDPVQTRILKRETLLETPSTQELHV